MAWILKKFFKEFNKILDARKYALDDKAVNWDYPRVFVTRPLPLPSNLPAAKYPSGFRSNRRKFNKLLDKAKSDGKFTVMNLGSFTSQNKNQLFDPDGIISEKGYRHLWTEISDAVQKDDDQVRMMINKLKAKQLAKSMEEELMTVDSSDDEEKTTPQKRDDSSQKKKNYRQKSLIKSPVRQSLTHTFAGIKKQSDRRVDAVTPSQTTKVRDVKLDSPDNRNHHKPPRRFNGFYKPRRRYQGFHPYFNQYPHPDFRPGPGYYHF